MRRWKPFRAAPCRQKRTIFFVILMMELIFGVIFINQVRSQPILLNKAPLHIAPNDPSVVVQGHLERRSIVDETADDGSKKNWAVLIPDQPVILLADDTSGESEPVNIITLVSDRNLEVLNCGKTTHEKGFYPLYLKYLGRRVRVKGSYYHKDNGSQPTPVLVFASRMEVLDCPKTSGTKPISTSIPSQGR